MFHNRQQISPSNQPQISIFKENSQKTQKQQNEIIHLINDSHLNSLSLSLQRHQNAETSLQKELIDFQGVYYGNNKNEEKQKQNQFCPFHNKKLQAYCETDTTLLCIQCLLSQHKTHQVLSIEQKVHNHKQSLNHSLQSIQKSSQSLTKYNTECSSLIDKLRLDMDEYIFDINLTCKNIICQLREIEQSFINTTKKTIEKSIESILQTQCVIGDKLKFYAQLKKMNDQLMNKQGIEFIENLNMCKFVSENCVMKQKFLLPYEKVVLEKQKLLGEFIKAIGELLSFQRKKNAISAGQIMSGRQIQGSKEKVVKNNSFVGGNLNASLDSSVLSHSKSKSIKNSLNPNKAHNNSNSKNTNKGINTVSNNKEIHSDNIIGKHNQQRKSIGRHVENSFYNNKSVLQESPIRQQQAFQNQKQQQNHEGKKKSISSIQKLSKHSPQVLEVNLVEKFEKYQQEKKEQLLMLGKGITNNKNANNNNSNLMKKKSSQGQLGATVIPVNTKQPVMATKIQYEVIRRQMSIPNSKLIKQEKSSHITKVDYPNKNNTKNKSNDKNIILYDENDNDSTIIEGFSLMGKSDGFHQYQRMGQQSSPVSYNRKLCDSINDSNLGNNFGGHLQQQLQQQGKWQRYQIINSSNHNQKNNKDYNPNSSISITSPIQPQPYCHNTNNSPFSYDFKINDRQKSQNQHSNSNSTPQYRSSSSKSNTQYDHHEPFEISTPFSIKSFMESSQFTVTKQTDNYFPITQLRDFNVNKDANLQSHKKDFYSNNDLSFFSNYENQSQTKKESFNNIISKDSTILKDSQQSFSMFNLQQRILHFGGLKNTSISCTKINLHAQNLKDIKTQILTEGLSRTKSQCVMIKSYSHKKCLILGGKDQNGQRTKSIFEYDIESNKLNKSHFLLAEPVSGFGAVVKENKLYVFGGSSYTALKTLTEYSVEKNGFQVRKLSPMINSRDQLGFAMGYDGFLYVAGGINSSNIILNSCERYCFKTNKWTSIPPMRTPRRSFVMVSLPHSLYVIGGHDGRQFLKSVEIYNFQTQKWTEIQPLNQGRFTHTAVTSSDYQQIIVFGGYETTPLKSIQIYNLMEQKWTKIQHLNQERYLHCSIILQE